MEQGAETQVFRAPMRARSVEYGKFEGARHGIGRGMVGTGEPLPFAPRNLSEAVLATIDQHGEKAGRMLDRFAGLPDGVFVWTRTDEEVFRLGRIDGPWSYDRGSGARATGIHQIRPTVWLSDEFGLPEVPEAVAATFARGGRNFQRIGDRSSEDATTEIWFNRRC